MGGSPSQSHELGAKSDTVQDTLVITVTARGHVGVTIFVDVQYILNRATLEQGNTDTNWPRVKRPRLQKAAGHIHSAGVTSGKLVDCVRSIGGTENEHNNDGVCVLVQQVAKVDFYESFFERNGNESFYTAAATILIGARVGRCGSE